MANTKVITQNYIIYDPSQAVHHFVVYYDYDKKSYAACDHKYFDSNGKVTKALRGYEINIAHTLEECLRLAQENVNIDFTMQMYNISRFEARQIVQFGVVKVSDMEYMKAVKMAETGDNSLLLSYINYLGTEFGGSK